MRLVVATVFLFSCSVAHAFPFWPFDGMKGIVPATMAEMVLPFGYPLEEHEVTTEDGYILTMYRIPYGKNTTKLGPRPALLLQHGILASSACWVLNEPEHGLAFILADAGYDVWLGNSRGSTYSQKHKFLDPNKHKQEYWNFSFHEMGYYDLPAMIDFILQSTGEKKLSYVGHSQGTTQFFAMAASRPEYNDKVKVMSALAPIAFLDHTRGTVRVLSSFSRVLSWVIEHLGIYQVLQNNFILHFFDQSVCRKNAITRPVCDNILFLVAGYDSQQLNVSLVPIIADHCPAGCSTKQLIHFGQLANNGEKFTQFDYGKRDNLQKYGIDSPPEYDLSKITTPIMLHYAQNDWLAGVQDVEKLHQSLRSSNAQKFEVTFAYFNHLDFMWAIDAKKLVYDRMIQAMQEIEQDS
jgi:lysosomal acid lipase/cholesteryl ester hydrolase